MKNKTIQEPAQNRVICFLEGGEYTILIDQNSNMLQNLFDFLIMLIEIRNKANGTNDLDFNFNFSIGFGEFSKRAFYKISLLKFTKKEIDLLCSYLDHNLILYTNES